jgi:hypothetical protein
MTTEALKLSGDASAVMPAGDAKVGKKKKAQVDSGKSSDFELDPAAAGGDYGRF